MKHHHLASIVALLSLTSAFAQNGLDISTAVELTMHTHPSNTYALQCSSNLTDWVTTEEFPGQPSPSTLLLSTKGNRAMFYRLENLGEEPLCVSLPVGTTMTMIATNTDGLKRLTLQHIVAETRAGDPPRRCKLIAETAITSSYTNHNSYYFRSTTREYYEIDSTGAEVLVFKLGDVGTTWSDIFDGSPFDAEILATNETVTIPAGTFSHCFKVRWQFPSSHVYYWATPGLGLIKLVSFSDTGFIYDARYQSITMP